MESIENKEKTNLSFWQLISQYEIRIPQLQRDYAQGRDDESITQIRETLIAELYEAIKSDNQLVLNFIYGDNKVSDGTLWEAQTAL